MSEKSDLAIAWQFDFRHRYRITAGPEFSLGHLNIFFLSFRKEYFLEDKVLFIKHFVDFVDIIVGIIEKVKEDFTAHIWIVTQ